MNLRIYLRRYPNLRKFLQRLYRGSKYNLARLIGTLRKDDLSLLYVSPASIQSTINQFDATLTGNAVWHIGSVSAGDWDLLGVPVKEHDQVFEILAAHIDQNNPFNEIPQFQARVYQIEQGKIVDSCTTPAEYHQRWQDIVTLYKTIQNDGYKTQAELGSNNPLDEIRVQIGRKGDFLFEEGLHRLAIAQHLQLPLIPVLVTRRHADWNALRSAVLKIVIQRGFIHQPFDHPDLDSLPQLYGNEMAATARYGHERWRLISHSLPIQNGTVLDIGAYFGYFDHRLENLGFRCIALEPDRENLEVLRLYKTMFRKKFEIWPESLFDIKSFEFDIVLALNIFHHLVRTKFDYESLVDFLSQLKCQALYLEPDANKSLDAYRHFSDLEFVHFVQKYTGLKNSQFLGTAEEGRPVYLLT